MTRLALFVVGAPGVGKTTLVRRMLGFPYVAVTQKPDPKWTLSDDHRTIAAGHYIGGTFDGADTIAYNGAAAALDFWEAECLECQLTIFDGDRFSHGSALTRVAQRARVVAVYLTASDELLTTRRAERGSRQNASWMRGRATKAQRFFELFSRSLLANASHPPDAITAAVREFLAAEARAV